MAYNRRTLALIIVLTGQLAAQNISIRDFTIPESRYGYLLGTLEGSYNSSRHGGGWYPSENRQGRYTVGFTHLNGRAGEDERYAWSGYFNGTYQNQDSRWENNTPA